MAEVAGINGKVAVDDATAEIGLTGWSLDYTAEVLDTTTFDDAGVKTYVVGMKGWSGTISGFHQDASDPSVSNIPVGSSIALRLYLDANDYYSGTAFVTSHSVGATVGGVNTSSYTFTGTGALSFTAA